MQTGVAGLGFEERRYQHLSPVQTRTRHPPGLQRYIKAEQKMPNQSHPCNSAPPSSPTPQNQDFGRASFSLFAFLPSGHLSHGIYIAPVESLLLTRAHPAAQEIVGIAGMRRGTAPGALFPRKSPTCRVRPLHLFPLLPNT